MTDVKFAKVVKALQDPAYVAVGLGVLGFQRAQVCRRELERHLGSCAGAANQAVDAANHRVADAAADVAGDVFGEIAGHLPTEAKEFLRAAGDVANDLSGEARELLKEAVAIGRFAIRVLQGPIARRAHS